MPFIKNLANFGYFHRNLKFKMNEAQSLEMEMRKDCEFFEKP
jgi:hypothetical protein